MTTFQGIRTIGATQITNSGSTSNDGDSDLVNGLASPRAETVDNTNAFSITNVDPTWLWERNVSWRFTDAVTPPTAQITVTVPTTPERGIFGILNLTTQIMQIETSAQVLTAPTLAAGARGIFCSDGTNVELLASS